MPLDINQIPGSIFRTYISLLTMPLYNIFNALLEQNIFPSYWKYANITPILKNNKNYRPISLLPFVSKVFEKAAFQFIIMPIANFYFKQY